VEPYRPVLTRVEIALPPDRQELSGLRVGFVTDTHLGLVTSAEDIDRALALLFAAEPDLLLLGGDFVCESPRFIPEAAAVFRNYAATPRLGAYAVLGNHDYANGASRVIAALGQNGIDVLCNASVNVTDGDRDLWVVGIDDAILGAPDPGRAFAGVPAGARPIALWHEPDWAEETARHGALIQFSGHSHGGQIRLPWLGNLTAPSGGRRYVSGLNDVAGMLVYTSRGVGVYRPPVRLNCPPEVTLLTLV
jgi:predicted MPP superfamily phosphohydrolase